MSYLDGKTPVGFKYDPVKELHPSFQAFPTYPIILGFKHTDQEVVDYLGRSSAVSLPGIPKVDYRRVLDGQRRIQFFKPLPVTSEGMVFELRSTCMGVADKGKSGMVLDTRTDLVEVKSGEVYTRMEGSGFAVGQGGWGGPKGASSVNYPIPKDKKPDAVETIQTTPEVALLYRLNGDYNPLHASNEAAKANGFSMPILHGLGSWNITCAALLRRLGGSDPARLKEFQARFSSPVLPGNTLVIEMWKTGNKDEKEEFEEVLFKVTVKETGKVALSNGRALVKIVSDESKSKL